MFTGIVEGTGEILSLRKGRESVGFVVRSRRIARGLRVGDSIAVGGVCLTVTRRTADTFSVLAVEETLAKTTLGRLKPGDLVNLETPLTPTAKLGGHFVLGHVDAVGRVQKVELRRSSCLFWILAPPRYSHHLAPEGSIAVDGISFTIAKVARGSFAVSVIPHTLAVTTMRSIRAGDRVNLEFDILGKLMEQFVKRRRRKRE